MILFSEETLDLSDVVGEMAETADVASNVSSDLEKLNPNFLWDMVKDYTPLVLNLFYQLLIVLLIFVIGRKLIRWIGKGSEKALGKTHIEKGMKKFLTSLLTWCLYIILAFIIADRLGINTTSFLTFLGTLGLGIGLALQSSIANLAGGILILLMKPFVVGDYILFTGGDGTVDNIGLIYTTLITPDNKQVMVPNGSLSNGTITNVTAKDIRRVDLVIGIGYHSDLLLAKHLLSDIIEKNALVLHDREKMVYVSELGASSVVLGIRVWAKTSDYWDLKWALTEHIKIEFDKAGIEIPFNKMDIYIKEK